MDSLTKRNQTVMFIGGMFGSGKSTLAAKIQELYGPGCFNIEFAEIYKRMGGLALDETQAGRDFRDKNWLSILNNEIQTRLAENHELVIATSAFFTNERRHGVLHAVENQANVIPLMIALPHRTVYKRLKERPEGTNPVNVATARVGIWRMNRLFIKGDNTDLLLPSDLNDLPPEYGAMLNRNENNRHMVQCEDQTQSEKARWVVVPFNPDPETCIDLVKAGITDPYKIREYIESRRPPLLENPNRGIEYIRRSKE